MYLSHPDYMYLLEAVSERSLRLPHVKRLQIDYIPRNSTIVRQFFRHSFPSSLDMLVLHAVHKFRYNMEEYIEDIKDGLTRVKREIYFENFNFTKSTLEKTIKASR